MGIIIVALIAVPPFLAGLGAITAYWMIGSGVVAYGKSIMTVSERGGVEDFRKLETDEFMGREREIKMVLVRYVALMALAYSAGYVVSYFGA